jgi:molybdopterin-guanine dinucleotide biosynthesis protein A
VIGVVLAGGAGSRLGADSKPATEVAGRPLISYPLAAVSAVCSRVAVVCKKSTSLPALGGVERWDEPDSPRHPLTGIVFALERAGEPVLVCAADMPFVTADACRSLLDAPHKSVAVVAVADGVLQPVFAVYAPAALAALTAAPDDAPLTRTVEGLSPTRVALPARVVRSVNTPEELADAERALAQAL